METEFAGLSLEEEEDEILQVQTEADMDRETEVLQLVGCFLTENIVHFPANLWHPVRGVQIRDLGEKRMTEGVKTKEMGWDLSLRAQSRRAQMMTSVWLREEGEEQGRGNNGKRQFARNNSRDLEEKRDNNENIYPILGKNLVGKRSQIREVNGNWSGILMNNSMEHELEDEVIISEKGKKRNRREMEVALTKEETNILAARSRRTMEVSHQSSASAKWQADRAQ
ncbi:hypothetical protein Goarm_022525 [Gossypium armourianum]|uniref:Uncharacterized protein n=1 Tax=Gossypium armourianum TaxID=34283 RepID=A0A7J9KFE2_9ROSI|nr:hypothetical protein [Gossypium armourianum]